MYGLGRYKVLGGAYVLNEFTLRDLGRYAEVPADTARKVVTRSDPAFFEERGRAPARGRGSPPIRYRVRPDRAAELESLLGRLRRQLAAVTAPAGATASAADGARRLVAAGYESYEPVGAVDLSTEPSVELLSAEHALLATYRQADSSEDRDAALRSAVRDRQVDRERSPDTARGEVVDALIDWARLERDFEGGRAGGAAVKGLDADALVAQADAASGREFAEEVGRWLQRSPLRPHDLSPAGAAEPFVGGGSRWAGMAAPGKRVALAEAIGGRFGRRPAGPSYLTCGVC